MMDYKNILLATDLSTHSDAIAARARDTADKSDARLSMVYVMEHFPAAYGGEYAIPIDVNLEEALETKAKESLAKIAEKFSVDTEDQYLTSGSVKLAVNDTAEEMEADLIVVGAHSQHHGLDFILGSRATSILNHANCDVLIIKIK